MGKLFKLAVAGLTAWQVHKMKNQLLDDVQSAEAQGKVNQGRLIEQTRKTANKRAVQTVGESMQSSAKLKNTLAGEELGNVLAKTII